MRNQTPLVPGQPVDDVTVHIVLNYFGSRLGRTYCEYEADQETIIESILTANIRIRSEWSPSTPPKAGRVM